MVMHYLGTNICFIYNFHMSAMVFPGDITWDYGIVSASIAIALVASTAAFWILFRLLSLYPQKEVLRLGSAAIMTTAVCGMHYAGQFGLRHVL
jgi:NO-binding membrane sensor protein with MHYT domain